jgi:uncharacterized protein YjbI with pentapeptide repeats
MKMKLVVTIIATAALILVALGGANAMGIFKNDFEQKWEELSQDVKKLNEYTALRPVELRNVKVSERNLDGAIFTGAKFIEVEWENSTSKKSTFTKVVFEKCKFTQSNFSYSTFTDVVFKDCEFLDADIDRSKLIDVRFEGCKFNQMGLVENEGNTLSLVNCHMLDSGMGDCTIDFEIKDSTLDGVDVSTSKGGRKVHIEGGLLSEVDFGDSHFSTVTLRRVRQGEGGVKFNGITAKDILLEDVDLDGIGFMNATADTAIIRDSQILAIGFIGGGIDKIYFSNSTIRYFDIAESMMPHVEFTKCKLYEPMLYDGLIEELAIRESTITDMKGKNFKADIVLWDNVTLDGKIDLTNAQVKDFRPTRLKRGPKLNLITTGSNMKF